jgi:glycosyltransferase involved in cell wall biosynthesis
VSVLFDIQGIQSRLHGERGISRYLLELARALEKTHPELVAQFLLNRGLAVPGSLEPLMSTGKLAFADRLEAPRHGIYHIGSPFELGVPLDHLWPPSVRHLRFVITVYDLIPHLFPDIYLLDPSFRRRYEARLELIRRADRVLAISRSSADDVIEHLGIAPDRVDLVGAGVSERFRPPSSRASALEAARREMAWLEPGFLLYTGGIEARKNIDGLLRAYSILPPETRATHQLVIVCRVHPSDQIRLDERLATLGIADRVHFPGFVAEEQLVLLNQSARLVVFPSFYEGFGLPVAEAIACGTPVVVSDTPALAELVKEPSGRFDPLEPREIASTIEKYLASDELLDQLRAEQLGQQFTWGAVAERTSAAYHQALRLPQRRGRTRRKIAFVSPFPPQRSGVADESYRLVGALAKHCDVDAFADGPDAAGAQIPEGVSLRALHRFDTAERAHAGYDKVFYCLGNSQFHTGALSLLRRRPGVVIAHDVRLNGLYSWSAHNRPDLEPRSFHEIVHVMYQGRLPGDLGEPGWITFEDADRHGVFMAQETIACSEQFFVHSNHAAQLAKLEAAAGDEQKIAVIPFGVMSPDEFPLIEPSEKPSVVATFGFVGAEKQSAKIVEAFPHVLAQTEASLAIVGPYTTLLEKERLAQLAAALGITERLVQTGYVEEDRMLNWFARATVAVQLRAASNGETSAAVARCLAAGVPTVVTNIGSAAELPDACVVKVERDVSPETLGEVIADLIDDPERRAAMASASVEYARANSYDRVARILYDDVVLAGVAER